jgi:adenylate kinase family enzyme
VRINVIGTSGSGKTTFGRQLAEVLNLPFIEMDAIFWGPGWKMPPDEDFFPRLSKALDGENWVLDGNYTRTMEFKWDRVQAVVWLNYSYPRTICQAVKRALTRLFDQKELWPETGNRENLKMLFSRDSIVWYTISKYHRHTQRNAGYMMDKNYSHIKFHRIRSPQKAKLFLSIVQDDPSFMIEHTYGLNRK